MQRSQGIPSFLCMNIWLKVRNNTLAPCHFNSSHFGLCVFYIATKTYLPNPATGQFSVTKLSLRLQPNEKRPNSQRENSWSQPFIRVPITGNRSEFRTTRTGQGRPQRLWQLCKGIWCKNMFWTLQQRPLWHVHTASIMSSLFSHHPSLGTPTHTSHPFINLFPDNF